MASFPDTVKSFASRSNGQVIDAAHVGDLQDEVNAIEDGYLNGTARLNSSNSTIANLSVAGGSTFTGAVSFSTGVTLSTGTLTLNQGQIVFPATQVPSASTRTLDDYREDTWTPTDGSGAGLSLTVTNALYVKIGQFVIAGAHITYPATADGSAAVIGGLPFASQNISGRPWAGQVVNNSNSHVAFRVNPNATTVQLLNPITANTVANSALSGIVLTFTAMYRAAN